MAGIDLTSLRFEGLIAREWLAANGAGGYACSTLAGLNTRKYHGLLVAAMAPPVRQMVLLSRVEETVAAGGKAYPLSCNEYPGEIHPRGFQHLRAFSREPFPRWAYQADGWTIEKSLCLLPGENTVCLTYTLLGGREAIDFEVRPLFALRGIHELALQWNGRLAVESAAGGEAGTKAAPGSTAHRIPATGRTPEVFFAHDGAFQTAPAWYLNAIYRREQERGYGGLEDVWAPGVARWELQPGQAAHLVCSADSIDFRRVLADVSRQCQSYAPRSTVAVEIAAGVATDVVGGAGGGSSVAASPPPPDAALRALTQAAGAFAVSPGVTRDGRAAPAHPQVMAGYPWAPASGRDAMIAFPGLYLATGKLDEARDLLAFYATQIEQGLLPSEWPTDGAAPLRRSADASLWYVNAVGAYLRYGGDADFVRRALFDVLDRVLRHYQHGTALGLKADSEGLLASRQPNTPTSWMDAKVGDWVITPRQGRTVELNALWYNALRVVADLAGQFALPARAEELLALADTVKLAFDRRFWNADARCCYDVVDDHGHDPSVRPNQILAVALPHPVLAADRHADVVERVRQELLTPVGLRTLSPRDANYQGRYAGGIVQRDRAYHQGSAYPWLLGPFVSAFLRVRGRGKAARAEARQMLEGCLAYLAGDGLGQICELFDGSPPHAPGGLIASARSVGEILRAYAEDVLEPAAVAPKVAAPAVGVAGGESLKGARPD